MGKTKIFMNDEHQKKIDYFLSLIYAKELELERLQESINDAIRAKDNCDNERFNLMIERFCFENPLFGNYKTDELKFTYNGELIFFKGFVKPYTRLTKISSLEFFKAKKDGTRSVRAFRIYDFEFEFNKLIPVKP